MSRIECLFQSFQGYGSIFISTSTSSITEHLKKNNSKALVKVRRQKTLKQQNIKLENLQQITIKTEDLEDNLSLLFLKASNFISQAKKHTNVIVWSPDSWELGLTFVFAHLILKYGHSLQYIWHLYQKKIKTIALSEKYVQQLQKLAKNEPIVQEVKQELPETVIGKRILRIRKEYTELAKGSHQITEVKKLETPNQNNPEKSTKKEYISQNFRRAPSNKPLDSLKRKASDNHQNRTHRGLIESFDI